MGFGFDNIIFNLTLYMQKDRLTHAIIMCKSWHEGQVRKYTGEPYWNHPIRVMELNT